MKETSYYELKMPDSNDTIDVSVLNNNMKRLDDVLILTVIGRTAETSEFVKKCCAPYIMIQNLGEETVTIYDRRWPEDMWEDNKIVIEPTKFYIYRVANSVNANFLVLDNKECNFRYFITAEQAIAEGGGGGGGGTTDYNELDNQPKVNGIVLVGNKSFKELGLLNDDGKIKSDYLPPFVDNMDSYDTEADFPRPGVEDRLYLDKSTNLAYIWTGTDYACIGTPLALGITHETAGYGDESRAAYNHSLSEHARVDATKTEASNVNGKIKINETDVDVYTHPQAEGQEATNPHGTTASDVGLGNLLNAKQVTVTEQAYSDTEKAQARKNIGAGTSSFSGKYSDLTEIPSEFTPAEHNHDDLYAHKTSVSSGENSTTSVINVTDAKAQMAMIKSIKGKTVKVQNVIKYPYEHSTRTTYGITIKDNGDGSLEFSGGFSGGTVRPYFGIGNWWSTEPWNDDNNIFLKSGTSITIAANSPNNQIGLRMIALINDGGSKKSIYDNAAYGRSTLTYVATQDCYIGLCAETSVNVGTLSSPVTIYPMAEFGDKIHNYIAPSTSQIYSAPVESVVSQGVNLVDKTKIVDGNWWRTSSGNSDTPFRRLNYKIPAGTYTISPPSVNDTTYNVICTIPGTDSSAKQITSGTTLTLTFDKEWSVYAQRTGATGVSSVNDFLIKNTLITASSSMHKTTVLVPSAVKNLPDYGCSIGTIAQNIVDFENGVYYHNVGHIDLGSLTWTRQGSSSTYYNSNAVSGIKKVATRNTKIMSAVYTELYNSESTVPDKSIFVTSGGEISINDSAFGGAASLKGKYLTYELASPETIPLSDYLRPLPVENGGTITLVNEHNLDMPSVIKYKKEV